MKTPSFWYKAPGFLSHLLSPLGWLFGRGACLLRTLTPETSFSIPIISVGNLVSGGSGKTPVALALAKILQKKGHRVHFVTRGYKGSLKGPLKVHPHLHFAKEVGDEPLLLSLLAPTWVAKNRPLGIQKAIENGATLIILDDGHQTTGIRKDLSFVVVDALQGFGNGYILPAGPLRESLSTGLARAHALIEVGEGTLSPSKPLFRARSVPRPLRLPTKRVLAFCGLGFPQKFYQSLEEAGFDIVSHTSFPDHHTYTEKELLKLEHSAHSLEASLVTTRKDWVKLPLAWQKKVPYLEIEIVFDNPTQLSRFLQEKTGK